MIFVLLILIVFLGIFSVVKKFQNEVGKQNLPPGPWGLPFLGHLVFLGRNPHLTLTKWKKKYGPIFQIRFGSFPAVVLCGSKLTKEAFNMMEFSGRPAIQVIMENNLAKGIIWDGGVHNTQVRQFAIRKLKEFGMGRKTLEDKIHDGISEFMDFIKEREGLPLPSENVPYAHIIKSLWSIMMTEELNPVEIECLAQIMHEISQLGSVVSELAGFMPWMEKMVRILTFGRFSLISNRSNQIKEMYSFLAKSLEQKKQNWVKDSDRAQFPTPVDIMDCYLEKSEGTTDESSPFHPSHDRMTYFLLDLFAGGIHTVHLTLLWAFVYMAKHPEVQLKLQEEIDEVVGTSDSRLPSLLDRGQMPYAEALVNEVLRMSSIAPILLPHNTTTNVRFHGYDIKKDTMIYAHVYGVHHDPEIWGDPENFRPERWLGEPGKKLKSDHFLPFSTGRKNCVGEALAREELFLYVTTLFQKYCVGFHGNKTEVKVVFGLTLNPSKFTVVFNQREIHKNYSSAQN